MGWSLALKDVPISIIKNALVSFIKEKPDGYKPVPGEYLSHCRKLYKDSKITKQIEDQYLDSEEMSLLPGTEQNRLKSEATNQFKNISNQIKSRSKTAEKTTVKPIEIFEYLDKHGKPQSYVAYSHHNKNHFEAEVMRQFSELPYLINHIWMNDQKIINRDQNGNAKKIGVVSAFVPCNENRNGAIAVTIGFLR